MRLSVSLEAVETKLFIEQAYPAIQYWANTAAYTPEGHLHITHDEGECTLTPRAIVRGTHLALKNGLGIPDAAINALDNPSRDMIIQYGLFGKLVYG